MNTPTYKTMICLSLFVLVICLCYWVGRYFLTMYENLDTLTVDIKLWIKGLLPHINNETMDLLTNGRSTMDSSFNIQKTNGFTQRGIFTDTDLAKVMKSGVLTDEEFTDICKNADLNDVEVATMVAAKTKLVESYVPAATTIKPSVDVSGNTMASDTVMMSGNAMVSETNGNAVAQS